MANIPIYEPRVGVPSPSSPRPTASAAGLEIGEGLTRLGNVLTEISAHYEKTRRDQLVETTKLQSVKQLQELTFMLANGSEDEDGNMVAPPAAELHEQIFTKRVKEINDMARATLGDYYGLYETAMLPFVAAESINVRKHAIERQKGDILATFDQNTEVRAELAAKGNLDVRRMVLNDLQMDAEKLVAAGIITAPDAVARIGKFENRLAVHDVREDIRLDPQLAIERLLTETGYPGLDPAAREAWLKTASAEADRRARLEDAKAERARRDAERAQTELEQSTAKEMVDAEKSGRLSPDLVFSKKSFLSRTDYEHFMDRARGVTAVRTVPEVYANLRWRQLNGANVTREALRAYEGKQLDRDALEKLIPDSEENRALKDIPGWFKAGEQYINRFLGAQFVQSDLEKRLLAEAQDDWRAWGLAHKDTDEVTARKEYNRLADEYGLVKKTQLQITVPVPRFSPQTQRDLIDRPALKRALDETEDRYERKEIDQYEYMRQKRIILEWSQHLAREDAKIQPQKLPEGR